MKKRICELRLTMTTVRCITVLRFVIFHPTRYVYNDRSTFRRFSFYFFLFSLFVSVLLRFWPKCIGMSLHSLSNDLLIFHAFCSISHKPNAHIWENTVEAIQCIPAYGAWVLVLGMIGLRSMFWSHCHYVIHSTMLMCSCSHNLFLPVIIP